MLLLRSLRLLPKAVSVKSKVELEKNPLKSLFSPELIIDRSKLFKLSATFWT